MFILLLILFAKASIIYDTDINLKVGQNQFNLFPYQIDKNSQQIQIKLMKTDDQNISIIVCDSLPLGEGYDLEEYYKKYGCIYKINQPEQDRMTINYKRIPKQFNNILGQYSAQNDEFYVIILSKEEIELQIQIIVTDKDECIEACKNEGQCINGYCQCQIGYIGSDCYLQMVQFNEGYEMQDNTYYYININETQTTNNSKYYSLRSQKQYQLDCYFNTPLFSNYTKYDSNNITLTQDEISECNIISTFLYKETQIEIPPYFIFFNIKEDEKSNNLIGMIIGIVIGSTVALFIIGVIWKISQSDIEKEREKQSNEFINQILEFYMPKIILTVDKQKEFDGWLCAICLQSYKMNDELRVTYCKHYYHDACLQFWLQKKNTCPMCRQKLDLKTLQLHHDQEILEINDGNLLEQQQQQQIIF